MKKLDRIYLVGMPAAGKTTVGKLVAQAMQYDFFDMDQLLIQKHRRAILHIFEEQGEPAFRRLEANILREYLPEKSILATGGGMPCFHDNMLFILQNGLSIFLNIPIKILLERVLAQQGKRPLFSQQSTEKLLNTIEMKYRERIQYYRQADITIDYDHLSVDNLLYTIRYRQCITNY